MEYYNETLNLTDHEGFDNCNKLVKVEVDSIYKSRISCPQLHSFIL